MPKPLPLMLVLCLGLSACGKDAPPPQTPEALVSAYLAALTDENLGAATALGPVESDQDTIVYVGKRTAKAVRDSIETDFYRKTEGTDQFKWETLTVAHVDLVGDDDAVDRYVATLREGDHVHTLSFPAIKAKRGMVLLGSTGWRRDSGQQDTWDLLRAHYDRMWALLDANQKDAKAAGAALDAYLEPHAAEVDLLAKRHAAFVSRLPEKRLMSYAAEKLGALEAAGKLRKRLVAANPDLAGLFDRIAAFEKKHTKK